jgi:hypothetical protein
LDEFSVKSIGNRIFFISTIVQTSASFFGL